jgi:glycosyltransferase involved in cell wall biosynthesis
LKLSLLLPTHNSAATIERTLSAALAQRHRPLEVVVYDEASGDDTRAIVRRLIDAAPDGVDARLLTAEDNSGPVLAWRVPLHDATGDWCTFVWADDVLRRDFSEQMMAAADRAQQAGRKLVTCSGEVEIGGEVRREQYASDSGVLSPQAFSAGMFHRRYPLTQICATYETSAAREVFDRHVRFDNPLGFDYNRHPYGNDVGYLSELAAAGGGTERLGDTLVTLTDSESSMTRVATGSHLWQMRWQYTFNQARVWRTWETQGLPGADKLRAMGVRRLALCTIMLQRNARDLAPRRVARAVGAYLDFLRFDFQKTRMTLDDFRRRLTANGIPA